jgi:hypothetical protein
MGITVYRLAIDRCLGHVTGIACAPAGNTGTQSSAIYASEQSKSLKTPTDDRARGYGCSCASARSGTGPTLARDLAVVAICIY